MDEKTNGGEIVGFGMTAQQIIEKAGVLCQRKARNHPAADFFATARKGRELLEKQGNYCQAKKK